MFVVRADSLAAANAVAASDPTHQAGARSLRVQPWLINEGSVVVHIRLFDLERGGRGLMVVS